MGATEASLSRIAVQEVPYAACDVLGCDAGDQDALAAARVSRGDLELPPADVEEVGEEVEDRPVRLAVLSGGSYLELERVAVNPRCAFAAGLRLHEDVQSHAPGGRTDVGRKLHRPTLRLALRAPVSRVCAGRRHESRR